MARETNTRALSSDFAVERFRTMIEAAEVVAAGTYAEISHTQAASTITDFDAAAVSATRSLMLFLAD